VIKVSKNSISCSFLCQSRRLHFIVYLSCVKSNQIYYIVFQLYRNTFEHIASETQKLKKPHPTYKKNVTGKSAAATSVHYITTRRVPGLDLAREGDSSSDQSELTTVSLLSFNFLKLIEFKMRWKPPRFMVVASAVGLFAGGAVFLK